MGFDKELFSSLFRDEDVSDFIRMRESDVEFSVSVISSLCRELMLSDSVSMENDMNRQLINGILNQCCRIMKVPRIYNCLSETLSGREIKTKVIDTASFLRDFAENCDRTLMGGCELTCDVQNGINVRVNAEHFTSVLLIYIRDVIINGAKRIGISNRVAGDRAEIVFNVIESYRDKKSVYDAALMLSSEGTREIIAAVTDSMDAVCEFSEDKVVLSLPLCGDAVLNSMSAGCDGILFNSYHVILSDLGNMHLI